jgi:hypothetical protein
MIVFWMIVASPGRLSDMRLRRVRDDMSLSAPQRYEINPDLNYDYSTIEVLTGTYLPLVCYLIAHMKCTLAPQKLFGECWQLQ